MKNQRTKKHSGKFMTAWKNLNTSIRLVMLIALIVVSFFVVRKFMEEPETEYITASSLTEAIAIEELSTAEFIYNGIAQKEKKENSDNYYYIAYESVVSVGVDMAQVDFDIDHEAKLVQPRIPDIKLNIVSVNPESLDYLPENPKLELDEILSLAKQDAITEANQSKFLYETAEDSLKSTIEALLAPILTDTGYSIVWLDNF